MAKKEVGITLALGGEKEYTQGFTNAVKATKMLQAETKSLAQEFEGSANSMQALEAKQKNLTKAQDAFKQKLEAANTGLNNARKEYEKQSTAVDKLKEKLNDAQKALEKMKDNGEEGSDSYKKQEKAVSELNTALQKQTQNMLSAQGRVTDWNKKVIESESDVRKNSRALEENNRYLDEAKSSANGCATSIDRFGKAAKDASDDVDKLGDAAEGTTKVSTSLKEKLGQAIVTTGLQMGIEALDKLKDSAIEATKYVIEVGSSFEAAMSEVEAISGASGDDLTAITDRAKELGASTKFSATEVAEGFKYMSLAGWSTSDMLSGIDGVLNLAAASGMQLAEASDMVTDYLSAFGMQASDSAKMADLLAYAQAHSNTSAKQLGEAYKNCAANLNSAGQDIETTTSFLEGMANQGLKSAEAGTTLTAIMRDITAKMKDGKIQIGDTSVAVQDAAGNYRDLTNIMTDVEAATEGLGTAEKNKALQDTFTADSIKGLNLILNEGTGKIAGYEEALRNSGGAAKEMADIMNDNLKGDLTEAQSALEGLGIAAYDYIEGPVRAVVQGVTGVIQGITEVITPQKDAVDELTDAAEAARSKVESIDADFTGATDSADRVAALGERLQELNSIENRSTVQKQEMAAIVEELSGSIPELQGAYDAERDTLSATNTELEELVTNYQKTAVQQAALAATQDLVNQKLEAQVQIDKAKDQKERAESRLKLLEQERDLIDQIEIEQNDGKWATDYKTEALKLYKQALDDGIITMDEYHQAEENIANDQMENRLSRLRGEIYDGGDAAGIMCASINELSEQIDGCNSVMEEQGKITEDCDQKIGEYTKTAEEMYGADKKVLEASKEYNGTSEIEIQRHEQLQQKADEHTKALEENTEATGEATDALEAQTAAAETAAEAQKNAMESMMDTYQSTVESIKSDLQNKINLFEKFDAEDKGQDATVEAMTENLQSQIDAFNEYQKNLEAVKDHVGKEIAPEFMQYLEDMGMDGANTLEHILQTFADEEPEKVKELSDKWVQAMNQTENIARIGAANQVALQMATGELGSTEADFSQLQESINAAVEAAGEGWSGLSEKTRAELDAVVQTAQECGVKIPDGLAEGIASGETSATDAIAQIQGSIQGGFEALVKMAEDAGINLPKDLAEGISSGETSAVDSYAAIIQAISAQSPELQDAMVSAVTTATEAAGEAAENAGDSIVLNPDSITSQTEEYKAAGKTLGEAVAEGMSEASEDIDKALSPDTGGITSKAGEYRTAGEELGKAFTEGLVSESDTAGESGTALSQAAIDVIQQQIGAMQEAARAQAEYYAQAIDAGKSQAMTAGAALAAAAKTGAASRNGEFSSVGTNIAAGVAGGIRSGQSSVINAAANMAAQALAAAKAKLGIHSPSKVFRVQVGKQISAGMAFGISDGASLASAAADKMSSQVYDKATVWLSAYQNTNKKKKQILAKDEKWYWTQVLKHTKQGTEAYNNATAKMIAAGVSSTKTTGSGKKQKTVKKDTETYYSEIYSAAEKYMSQMETLNDVSTKDQLAYWEAMAKQLKQGTTAWYNAQTKIKSIQAKIGTVSNMNNLLSTYKTYYDMSEKAEEEYWDIIRKQYAEGTDERLEADKKYLDAKEKYTDKIKDLEDDYNDKVEEVNKNLKDSLSDLEDSYNTALADRKKAIKDAYGLFDEFTSESAGGQTLLFNIKTQAAGYQDWMDQIQQLSDKGILNKDLMDELVEQGPEISAAIHALNTLTEDELKEYNAAYEEKSKLASEQAERDTNKLKTETEKQTKELNEQAEKDKEELKAAYDSARASVEASLSSSMTNLANSVRSIADDQTTKLVAAITGEARKTGMESTPATATGGGSTAGTQTAAAAPTATASAPAEDKILKIINSGKNHEKSLSAKEKKDHVALWEYIVKKYGHVPTNSIYTKLAKELSVKVSKTVTSAQKNEILKKLKAKGYRSGGRIWDDLTWMDEELGTTGPEMIVRKSDNAILTRTKPGDEIINARTAANLVQIGRYNMDDLRQMVKEYGSTQRMPDVAVPTGMANINKLMDTGMAAGATQTVDTVRMEQMLEQMTEIMSECMPYIRKIGQNSIVLDDGTLVGRIAEPMERALATRQRRRR